MWQAKFVFEIDDLLRGMTDSVSAVAKRRSAARRMTFVIPWNLPDGRRENIKTARQKYESKIEAWKGKIERANEIEFELVQESDLLGLLAEERHAGRQKFFFDAEMLSFASLTERQRQSADIAGERYRPDLQVDLPIQDDLDELALIGPFRQGIVDLLSHVAEWNRHSPLLPPEVEPLSEDVVTGLTEIGDLASRWESDSRGPWRLRAELQPKVDFLEPALSKLIAELRVLKASVVKYSEEYYRLDASRGRVTKLLNTVLSLQSALRSRQGELFAGKSYFLKGVAGSGKTHLLLDMGRRLLESGNPAAVLLADQFGSGDLFTQIAVELGLPPTLSRPELLGVLEACGAASQSRFVLAIDALNEGSDVDWASALPALQSAIAGMEHVALVVSVRTTYVLAIDPEARREVDYVERIHPGLSGLEDEAALRYFNHYGLPVPIHPLLTPEFTNPLFLKLYCESFFNGDAGQIGYEARLAVFDRFRRHSMTKASSAIRSSDTSLARTSADAKVESVLQALIAEMANTGSERIRIERALELASTAAGVDGEVVVSEFESSGLLALAPMYLEGEVVDGLRVAYEAFADHLILSHRWESLAVVDVPDEDFRHWLGNASPGIQEAASLWLPERAGVELVDFLKPEDQWAFQNCDRITLSTLNWRTADSITDKTFDSINRCLGDVRPNLEVYEALVSSSASVGHPLNSESLHSYLESMTLGDRDATFGVDTYDVLADEGPFLRLARWANAGPYPTYEQDVIELSVIPLVWLLGSPNRPMRDWLTKVLVKVLGENTEALCSIVRIFAKVNDVYIRERIVSVVYGSLLRFERSRGEVEALLDAVVEAYVHSPVAHTLLIDYVEGILEFGRVELGLDTASAIPSDRFKKPHHPWTLKLIEERYGYNSENNGCAGMWTSVSVGDFGRYVMDRCVSESSFTERELPRPERASNRDESYPPDRAKRWVFMRSIQIGWTSERFDRFDTMQARWGGQGTGRERFGKKYQWIAFYEFLARIQATYHPAFDRWSEDESRYRGTWDTFRRDIDPTTPPVASFPELGQTDSDYDSTFPSLDHEPAIAVTSRRYLPQYLDDPRTDPRTDYDGYPTFSDCWRAVDLKNDKWVVLDASTSEQIVDADVKGFGFGGLVLDQSTVCRTWAVPIAKLSDAHEQMSTAGAQAGGHDGTPLERPSGHVSCCFLGEVGWKDHGCVQRLFQSTRFPESEIDFWELSEHYWWEGSRFDHSIAASTGLTSPSAMLRDRSNLTWDGHRSWNDELEVQVAVCVGYDNESRLRGLVARSDWMSKWLAANELGLIARTWTERRDFRGESHIPFHRMATVVALDAVLSVVHERSEMGEW